MIEQVLAGPLRALRDLATEAAEFAETRLALLHVEWRREKSRLQALLVLVLAAMALGVLALMFGGFAIIVWFWDTPYRALAAGLVALTGMLACGGCVVAVVNLSRRGHASFALSRAELANDWRIARDRL